MYILSEYEQMEKKRLRYAELCERLVGVLNHMFEAGKALNLPWEGDASKAYIVRLCADRAYITEIVERLLLAGEILEAAIIEYQRNEKEIAQMIGGMKI